MNPVLKAVLLSWDFRVDVIIVLALAGTLFCRGWWRLRRQTRPLHAHTRHNRKQLGARWRLISYLSGLIIIAIALMSAIDLLAGQYFFVHMIQHLLLVMIAPPLLLIANPMPFMLWGLPDAWRRKLGKGLSQLLRKSAPFRQGLRSVTNPGLIWLIWVVSLIGWHDPGMYNAALRNDFVHDAEHLTFFLAAMLYWWLITGAGPRIHKQFSLPGRIVFTIAAVPPNMALGVVLSFVNNPVYTYYLTAPRLWPIEVLTDQKIGGVIMWIPGSMMYLIAALILISRLVQSDKVTR